MTACTPLEKARSETLRKIGRNVVNCQKIEAMLKHLMACSHLDGYLSELRALQERRVSAIAKQAMGPLTKALVNDVYSDNATAVHSEALRDVWISLSIQVKRAATIEEIKCDLSSLVAERNKLIHQMLATFNPDSIESCRKLTAILDDQHAKIVPEFEMLRSIMGLMTGALKDLNEELVCPLVSEGLAIDG